MEYGVKENRTMGRTSSYLDLGPGGDLGENAIHSLDPCILERRGNGLCIDSCIARESVLRLAQLRPII